MTSHLEVHAPQAFCVAGTYDTGNIGRTPNAAGEQNGLMHADAYGTQSQLHYTQITNQLVSHSL